VYLAVFKKGYELGQMTSGGNDFGVQKIDKAGLPTDGRVGACVSTNLCDAAENGSW